jgi:hypothetical protein
MTDRPHVHTLETKSLRNQDAQNGSTMSGFGMHLTDFLQYVNYEMTAEEAIVNKVSATKYGSAYILTPNFQISDRIRKFEEQINFAH